MAPHTWSHLGETVSDATHVMYYRGERIKEVYYRGEKIWGEEESDFIVSIVAYNNAVRLPVTIEGDDVMYSIDGGPKQPLTTRYINGSINYPDGRIVSFYGKNIRKISFGANGNTDNTSSSSITKVLTPFGTSCRNVTTLEYCFYGCIHLNEIPPHLFDNTPNVTSFAYCFRESNIQAIPSGLFDHTPNVTSFAYCFYTCLGLKLIPFGLFDHTPNVTSFAYCFYYCDSITSIPSTLFEHTPNVTSFAYCFYYCLSITRIPSGLFDHTPNVKSFAHCFEYTEISSIPSKLFDHTPDVTSFAYCFRGTYITRVPYYLFDYTPKVTTFEFCFAYCNGLQNISLELFNNTPNVTTFRSCFYFDVNLRYNVPSLWTMFPSANGTSCFYKCTKVSNYSSIPSSWK